MTTDPCSDEVHRAELQLLRDIERHYLSGGTMANFDDEDERTAAA